MNNLYFIPKIDEYMNSNLINTLIINLHYIVELVYCISFLCNSEKGKRHAKPRREKEEVYVNVRYVIGLPCFYSKIKKVMGKT